MLTVNEAGHLAMTRIGYRQLNDRQKENYNFAKLSAVLADFGYATLRLSDDWKGADLIAIHCAGGPDLRIQLKGRLTVDRKYQGKGLHIAFRDRGRWYVCPHDLLLDHVRGRIAATSSWTEKGNYHWPGLPDWVRPWLKGYALDDSDQERGSGE